MTRGAARTAGVVGLVVALALAAVVAAPPSAAADGTCRRLADGTWYCEHGTGGGGYPPGACIWIPFPDQELARTLHPEAGPDDVIEYYVCNLGTAENPVWAEPYVNTSTRVSPPGGGPAPPPPPIPPGALAAIFWISVQDTLLVPEVVTTPASGTASIIEQPTFLAVANWQGERRLRACHATGTCVELHLVPQLTYDPGVPGVDPIACPGGGTYFQPDGAEPAVQAQGGCAYTYRHRTGALGRPQAFAPRATIRWTASWTDVTAGGAGASGGLQAFEISSAPWSRPVDEVQGLVVEAEEGLG